MEAPWLFPCHFCNCCAERVVNVLTENFYFLLSQCLLWFFWLPALLLLPCDHWPFQCQPYYFILWHYSDTFLQFLRSVLRYSSSQATVELFIFGLRIMSSCGFKALTHEVKSYDLLGMKRQLIVYVVGYTSTLCRKISAFTYNFFLHLFMQQSNIVNTFLYFEHTQRNLCIFQRE